MNEKISNLIRFIVCYATEQGSSLTTVRLVKFVYLADLYHARWHDGQTYTNLPWAFIYYGPYCRNVMTEIDSVAAAGFIKCDRFQSKFADDKDYNIFSCKDQESETFRVKLPLAIISDLKDAIKKYGDETAALLDYVYFDTEPMMDAVKDEILDFLKAKRPETTTQINLKKLSKDDIARAKYHIKQLGERFERGRKRLEIDNAESDKLKDEAYYQALAYMDEEDLEVGLRGVARIAD